MAKQKSDFSTHELPISRPRGRPPLVEQTPEGLRLAAARRKAQHRARMKEIGLVQLTVNIPADLHAQIKKFLEFKPETVDQVVERFLRQAMRKR